MDSYDSRISALFALLTENLPEGVSCLSGQSDLCRDIRRIMNGEKMPLFVLVNYQIGEMFIYLMLEADGSYAWNFWGSGSAIIPASRGFVLAQFLISMTERLKNLDPLRS